MTIRVVIADDHLILLSALQSLLANESDIEIVATVHDGAELLKVIEDTKPDVAVVDIGMPGMGGLEVVGRLRAMDCSTHVVMLSAYKDKRYVMETLSAGARGYVVKSAAADELSRAIRSVVRGQVYLCPEVVGSVVDAARTQHGKAHNAPPVARLAPRERAIVRLLAEGKSSAQIAAGLCIALTTVETHRRNILGKLGMHNVAEVTRYAIREGIVGD